MRNKPTNSQQTPGFRDQIKLGQQMANSLTPLRSRADVGAELGISGEMVRRIECLALAKIAHRMRALNFDTL